MLSTILCPGCSAALKRPANLAAGKRIKCPQCETIFAPDGEANVPAGVTAAPSFSSASTSLSADENGHSEEDAPLEVPTPSARAASPGKGRSAPRKRSHTVAILAALVLVMVVFLGGAAVAVLILFGESWRPKSQSDQPAAFARPPMPNGPQQMPNQPPMQPGPNAPGPNVPGHFGPGANPPGPFGPGANAPGPFGPGANPPGPFGPGPNVPAQQSQPAVRVGQAVPEIEGKDLDGKAMKLSDFRGKVVVLDFWGDWCPFCKTSYARQRELLRRMQGRSFVLLGVNCDDTAEQARQVVQKQRLDWRSWWGGPHGQPTPIFQRWNVLVVPSIFVIDSKGVLRQRFDGVPPEGAVEATVESLLPPGERGAKRWLASGALLNQLGPETEIGAYRMRVPRDFVSQRRAPEQGQQSFLWKRSTFFQGATYLEVTIRPAAEAKPEEALEQCLAAVPGLHQGWSCPPAQRGEVNGLSFQRADWTALERGSKRPMSGVVFVALDGDTLIQIAARSTEANRSAYALAEAAALTFRKAPK
jgi:peroxiredoxin